MLFWRLLLSSCWLFMSPSGFSHSDPWPLSRKRPFPPHKCQSLNIFSFCDYFLWNPGDGCEVVKVSLSQSAPTTVFTTYKAMSCFSMIGLLASFKNILHILKRVCKHACFVRRALTMAKWESFRLLFSLRIKTRQHSPHSDDKNRNSCDGSPGQSTCLCFLVSRSPFIRESRAKNGENRNCGPAACL